MDIRNKYEVIQKLGSGASGSVYKAIRLSDQKVIAIKVIKISRSSNKFKQTVQELLTLGKISKPCHPNLVCYYGHHYSEARQELIIEMEYIDGQELDDFTSRYHPDKEKLYKYLLLIVKDLIKGIIYIHEKGILHNDIKPGNIMIDTSLIPKLIDFGLSCQTHPCKNTVCCEGYNGTPEFASPEMYLSDIRYNASDIWSLGVTLYYCATGFYPFSSNGDIIEKIKYEEPKKLETSNELLNRIVNSCLIKDPTKRITGEQINILLMNYE